MDQKWYQDFVADENLVHAASAMRIKPLRDLASLKIVDQLHGKNPQEVSAWFVVYLQS